jgi:hypothetical protein
MGLTFLLSKELRISSYRGFAKIFEHPWPGWTRLRIRSSVVFDFSSLILRRGGKWAVQRTQRHGGVA